MALVAHHQLVDALHRHLELLLASHLVLERQKVLAMREFVRVGVDHGFGLVFGWLLHHYLDYT